MARFFGVHLSDSDLRALSFVFGMILAGWGIINFSNYQFIAVAAVIIGAFFLIRALQ